MRVLGIVACVVALSLTCPGFLAADRRLNEDLTALPQGEITIAVNPNDPQHLVAAWIDWDGNRGQGVTTFHARSLDGGQTWQTARTQAPGVSEVWPRVDPALAFDGAGRVFNTFATTDPEHRAWALRSDDGGLTFNRAVSLTEKGADKTWIAADPVNGNVYATWSGAGFGADPGVSLSRSIDGGDTFSARVSIATDGGTAMVAVGPGSEVYVVYRRSLAATDIMLDRSLDGGVTWLASDRLVATVTDAPDPVNGGLGNPLIPTIAVDRTSGSFAGRIYVVWTDARDGDSDAYLSHSSDQGSNWSTPLRVNDDVPGMGTDQVMPWLWVDDEGHVHVMFFDRREDPDNLLYSVYMATSTDGGSTFGPNIRVSDANLPQGGLPLRPNTWIGDYQGGTGAGGEDHLVWADGRNGDLDVFVRTLNDADFDDDGVGNDGNGDGQYSNAPCTGGQSANCDDNCPGAVNVDQADADSDGVGDACDNCPGTANANQHDRDRDGDGDVCDACPDAAGRPAGDPDGDGVAECVDNCPGVFNDTQADGDGDGIGDVCDACATDPDNDTDGDGICDGVDNCPSFRNPVQADEDGDGVGNVCDNCPVDPNASQDDADFDGRGDLCDCQPSDGFDRAPQAVEQLRVFRTGSLVSFGWRPPGVGGPGMTFHVGQGFDVYSVTRGLLSSLRSGGTLGACLLEGAWSGFEDATLPPVGDGYFYFAQGQNFECGLGSPGYDSGETTRSNTDPAACSGHPFTDVLADSETSILGTVTGTLADTFTSNDVYETIQEEPVLGVSQMEHRYTFPGIPAGSLVEVHYEAFWTQSPELEAPLLEYSTDGGVSFSSVTGQFFTVADPNADRTTALPSGVSGTVILRWIDPDRGPTSLWLDQVSVDQLWIRSIP